MRITIANCGMMEKLLTMALFAMVLSISLDFKICVLESTMPIGGRIGYSVFNVYDIPNTDDYLKDSEKPIYYTATLPW